MGTGRVCGVSASRAPRITTFVTPSSSMNSRMSAQNVRQRIFGSMPCSSTTSRTAPGGDAIGDRRRGPLQFPRDAVDLPDRRTIHLVVVVILGVELRKRLGVPDELEVFEGGAGGIARVVPALERRDKHRVTQDWDLDLARIVRSSSNHPVDSLAPAAFSSLLIYLPSGAPDLWPTNKTTCLQRPLMWSLCLPNCTRRSLMPWASASSSVTVPWARCCKLRI